MANKIRFSAPAQKTKTRHEGSGEESAIGERGIAFRQSMKTRKISSKNTYEFETWKNFKILLSKKVIQFRLLLRLASLFFRVHNTSNINVRHLLFNDVFFPLRSVLMFLFQYRIIRVEQIDNYIEH